MTSSQIELYILIGLILAYLVVWVRSHRTRRGRRRR